MIDKKYIDPIMKHKHALIFAGGIATALIGKKILESDAVKDATTQGMAAVLSAKKDAEEAFQDMREMQKTLLLMQTLKSKKKSM